MTGTFSHKKSATASLEMKRTTLRVFKARQRHILDLVLISILTEGYGESIGVLLSVPECLLKGAIEFST